MRKILVAAAALVLSGGALLASRAEAVTSTAPAGMRTAIEQTSNVEQVRHRCYRTWRHGRWITTCPSHRPYQVRRYYAPYPYYAYPYPYYYRPYAYYRRPHVGLYFRF